jgi:hypothetical protein
MNNKRKMKKKRFKTIGKNGGFRKQIKEIKYLHA